MKYTHFNNEIEGDPFDNGQKTFGRFVLEMFIASVVILAVVLIFY